MWLICYGLQVENIPASVRLTHFPGHLKMEV
jgi:hypothetical protein